MKASDTRKINVNGQEVYEYDVIRKIIEKHTQFVLVPWHAVVSEPVLQPEVVEALRQHFLNHL